MVAALRDREKPARRERRPAFPPEAPRRPRPRPRGGCPRPGPDRRAGHLLGGIVSGEAILGTNIFRAVFAGLRDIVGGRSSAYEEELRKAKEIALQEMREQAAALGANAVIGVDLDYETIAGSAGNMLMVSASGTAVRLGV